jgi:hypothetical protein
MIEDAIPINVSAGKTRTAREVFTINNKNLRDKSELTKEEKRSERGNRKRKIKTHLKNKSNDRKEKRRELGMAQTDRFAMKEIKR